MLKIVKKFKPIFIIAGVVILAAVLLRFKSVIIAATVNGKPISRLSVIKELEKQGGRQILDNLVTNSLIEQEAAKEKVTVTKAEIDSQIAQITQSLKSSGQDLDSALKAQGMTQKDLEDQITLKIMVEKMATKDITVTDKDVEDAFNKNKATYPKGTKIESVSDQIKKDLTNQKTNEAISNWLANLKSKAKIDYFVKY